MSTTYDVKLGAIQHRSDRDTPTFIARWRVAGKQKSKSFRTKGLANAFMSDLRQAAKAGEEFDVTFTCGRLRGSGIPSSPLRGTRAVLSAALTWKRPFRCLR